MYNTVMEPKEFANFMRMNTIKNENDIVQVSPELWEVIASYIENMGMPCKTGDTVYKICPKCNNDHNGSCKHCAWVGCLGACDIGVRVYPDGSFNQHELQIIPYRVTEGRFITILKYWNLMFFKDEESANKALTEYDSIRKIEDRKERYEEYKKWEFANECHYSFMEE